MASGLGQFDSGYWNLRRAASIRGRRGAGLSVCGAGRSAILRATEWDDADLGTRESGAGILGKLEIRSSKFESEKNRKANPWVRFSHVRLFKMPLLPNGGGGAGIGPFDFPATAAEEYDHVLDAFAGNASD